MKERRKKGDEMRATEGSVWLFWGKEVHEVLVECVLHRKSDA